MEKNSIKQMLRMPVKTAGFFVLIAAVGFLLSLAAGMFVRTTANARRYEQLFKTIGTVEQTPVSTRMEPEWDAGLKDYRIWPEREYGAYLPVSVLDFAGADYIRRPEKRKYYASYSPEYQTIFDVRGLLYNPVVEFSPLEDCVPDQSVRIRITKVLYGYPSYNMSTQWFCSHYTEHPGMLYKDKTYVAALYHHGSPHGAFSDAAAETEAGFLNMFEYIPWQLQTNQYAADGTQTAGEKLQPYYEVTDGFYETPAGKMYLNHCRGMELAADTFPVTGTDAADLLIPFYNENAFISEGRDISEEAYENGLYECLVSDVFARNNGLKTGDSVTVNLLFASGGQAASFDYLPSGDGAFSYFFLMDEGECPAVFETEEYTIAGIYTATGYGYNEGGYQPAMDEMIVPMRSIRNQDENILAYGPMNAFTTSFQIPNGTIDAFRQKWEAQGIENIEITFYDKGYAKLERGMKNMRFMSIVFGIAGLIFGAVLLVFYSRMFISGQKVRITIERCMGITAAECRRSILCGAMLVLAAGSMLGCAAGSISAGSVSVYDMEDTLYDTAYTVGHTAPVEEVEVQAGAGPAVLTAVVCEALMLLAGGGILWKDIRAFLRKEPLYLLEEINRE